MNNLIIAFTCALPFITFLLGAMYGGAEARKELKAQQPKTYSFTHTHPALNRALRERRAQKN